MASSHTAVGDAMPTGQLRRARRRAVRAGLAVTALIASALAVGAAPAGAVTDRADHATRTSACAGDAATDRGFVDVSAGHAFRSAINCLAYYGITQGTSASTYSPEQPVTRAQMAVFIARTAEVAGVALGSVSDAGFDDIDDAWGEAQDAINRLAASGIIRADGAYRPNDNITRAEMADFLIGLLVEAAPNVTKDSSGAILLGVAGSRSVADDRFPDTDGAEEAAIYELGVTRGASAAEVQDRTKPPLDYNYEPNRTVDRGQMAAFLTRALAHTSVRPAGLSVQYNGADLFVSSRDENFRPISDTIVVDVFWAPTEQADGAFTADGACGSVVTGSDRSSYPCEIDTTDPITGRDGEERVEVIGLRRIPAGGATVWVWSGELGETVGPDTELHRLDIPANADVGFASQTLVATGFNARKARFGSSVSYTLQLQDVVGNVTTGLDGSRPAEWLLNVRTTENLPAQRLVSDNRGEASFSISVEDPNPGAADEITATYTLTAAENAPAARATVNADGQTAATGTVTFSDAAPSIAGGNASVTIDTREYVSLSGGAASNNATVTVRDQYGRPFPGTLVRLASSLSGVTPDSGQECEANSRGSCRFSYQHRGTTGATETLTATYGTTSGSLSGSETATVHWAVDAGLSDGGTPRPVVAGDARRQHIVVGDGDGPELLIYDDNDRFNLRGAPASMAAFEAELAAALSRATPGVTLTWSNYRAFSAGRVAEYDLT